MSYNWSHLKAVPAPFPREEVGYLLDKQRAHNAEFLCAVFVAARKVGYVGDLTVFTELLEIRRYLHLNVDNAKQIRWKNLVGQTIYVPWLPEKSFVVENYISWSEVHVRLPNRTLERRAPEELAYESLLLGRWQAGRLKKKHDYEVKRQLRLASLKTQKCDDQTDNRPTPWDNEPVGGNDACSGTESNT